MTHIQEFPSEGAARGAVRVFVDRGYRLVQRAGELWPGEVRLVETAVHWAAKDQDPDAPLWDRLRELHASGDVDRVAFALHALTEVGLSARHVFNALESGDRL